MNYYTCIDSFSGAGGLSLGLKWAGFNVIYSFDNDPYCIETQNKNFKHLGHKAELRSIEDALNDNKFLKSFGLKEKELFLLAGGPPCQGFSVQRIGQDQDERNDLINSYAEFVLKLKPKYFLMENVPGITGKRGSVLLEAALKKLSNHGYWIHQRTLDAQDYGVPQRRKRVFIIGERNDGNTSMYNYPSPITSDKADKTTVREVIGHLPPPPENGKEHVSIKNHRSDRLSEINKKRLEALKPGQGREHLPKALIAKCHERDAKEIGHRNVYGRMEWDDVAPTITARFDSFTRGKFGHPDQTRTISLREGALLQTFPEDFIFTGSKVDIARQIGNAVPPVLGKILGESIINSYLSEVYLYDKKRKRS